MDKFRIIVVVAESGCDPCKRFFKNHFGAIEKKYGKDITILVKMERRKQFKSSNFLNYKNFVLGKVKNDEGTYIKENARNRTHPQIICIKWTPTIMIVTKKSWNNKKGLLEGIVMRGKMSPMINNSLGGVQVNKFVTMRQPDDEGPPMTEKEYEKYMSERSFDSKNVIEWIDKNIKNNILFSSTKTLEVEEENNRQNFYGSVGSSKYTHRSVGISYD